MKLSLVGVVLSALALVSSCSSSDKEKDKSSSGASNTGSTPTDSGVSGVTTPPAAKDVECTHPGAGNPLGNGRCACATTRNVAGDWSALRTCREGDSCPTKDREETLSVTQNGTSISADRGGGYTLTGTLCGDFILWTGGTKDGLNPECGQIRVTDDNHYLMDSCYVASGDCARTYSQGCPTLKGQCTGTGTRKPENATPIAKVICSM